MISGSPDSLNQPGWERGLQSAQCKRWRSEQVPSASSCQWNSPFQSFLSEPFLDGETWVCQGKYFHQTNNIIVLPFILENSSIYLLFLMFFFGGASTFFFLMASYSLSVHTDWTNCPNDRCYKETHWKQVGKEEVDVVRTTSTTVRQQQTSTLTILIRSDIRLDLNK